MGGLGRTLADAFADATRVLRDAGAPSPGVDARWLVEAASGTDPRRTPDLALEDDAERALASLLARRAAREPLQLILGSTAFRTIELRCRSGVFVPRPETEVLAGIAIDLVRDAQRDLQRDGGGPVVVHEPCCGTGAVGLAVASEVDGAVLLLGDRSDVAVALALENRDALGARGLLRSHVEVQRGDLLDAFASSAHGAPGVIVANPPYLPMADLADLDPEVLLHDPHDALAGGPDGHEVVDVLLGAASLALVPGGAVVLEVDARRADEAAAVARRVGLVDVEVRRDLTGASRFVVARRPRGEGARR
jgi:release factor glutamine methyltransferase